MTMITHHCAVCGSQQHALREADFSHRGRYICTDQPSCLARASAARSGAAPARPGCMWPKCPRFADVTRELADAKTDDGPTTGERWHVCAPHNAFGETIGMWAPQEPPMAPSILTLADAVVAARYCVDHENTPLGAIHTKPLLDELDRLVAEVANLCERATTAETELARVDVRPSIDLLKYVAADIRASLRRFGPCPAERSGNKCIRPLGHEGDGVDEHEDGDRMRWRNM